MATKNPFHIWLGLSAELDNPNHYQLLEIDPAERDLATIERAAKEKLKLLKQADAEKHATLVDKIKKRIRLAYTVLANEQKRREYDQKLIAKGSQASVKNDRDAATPDSAGNLPSENAKGVDAAVPTLPSTSPGKPDIPMALPVAPEKGPLTAAVPSAAVPSSDVPVDDDEDVPELTAMPAGGVAIQKRKVAKRKRSPVALVFTGLLALASISGLVYLAMNWEQVVAFKPEVEEEKPPITKPLEDTGDNQIEGETTAEQADDVDPEKKIIKRPTKLNDIEPPAMVKPAKVDPEDDSTNTKPATIETGEIDFDDQVYFRRYMQAVQRALFRRQKSEAENQLSNAASLFLIFADNPSLQIDESQADWERLVDSTMQIKNYLSGFWEQVITSSIDISGGQEIEASGQIVGFVESTGEYVILRVGGKNLTYRYENVPPGLAVALAEQGAKEDVPTWRMQKAAFYAVHKDLDPDFGRKAKEFADQAAEDGHDPKPIYDYVDIDLNKIGIPESKTDLPDVDIVMKALNEMEIDVGVNVRRQMRPEQAMSAVDTLLDASITAGDDKERVIRLHAAYLAARKSLDAYLLSDTIREVDHWMTCEPTELLAEGLQMMSRKTDEMDERQKRGFVEVVIEFMEQSDDKRARQSLGTTAERICKENDFDDLLGRLN